MKTLFLATGVAFFSVVPVFSQSDGRGNSNKEVEKNEKDRAAEKQERYLKEMFAKEQQAKEQPEELYQTVSDKIKSERNEMMKLLNANLAGTDERIVFLKHELDSLDDAKTQERVSKLEELQHNQEERLRLLEEKPKTKTIYNGQLAFTELLEIENDIKPAELFSTSERFFSSFGAVTRLQDYSEFTSWRTEYDLWYKNKAEKDKMLELVNASINLIGDAAGKVPLYGSIVQMATSGISTILMAAGRKNNEKLFDKTADMLWVLNSISQLENEKAQIDEQWLIIKRRLKDLRNEHRQLLNDQMVWYKIDSNEYRSKYLVATTGTARDRFKESCRKKITGAYALLEADVITKSNWQPQAEVYMYRVQALRIKFGELTLSMLENIDRYRALIDKYMKNDKLRLPQEFMKRLNTASELLMATRMTFESTFRPEKYIEDSVVMYLMTEDV